MPELFCGFVLNFVGIFQDRQMWQDVLLAINHEHASDFVSTILDSPGSAQQPTEPATSTKEGRRNGKDP